jgi:hypothetical protein
VRGWGAGCAGLLKLLNTVNGTGLACWGGGRAVARLGLGLAANVGLGVAGLGC